MTDTVIVALIVGIPPTILAIATLVVGIRNSRVVAVIKTDVNSGATAARNEIKELQEQVRTLVADKAEKKQTAALLAQAMVERAEAKGE